MYFFTYINQLSIKINNIKTTIPHIKYRNKNRSQRDQNINTITNNYREDTRCFIFPS